MGTVPVVVAGTDCAELQLVVVGSWSWCRVVRAIRAVGYALDRNSSRVRH